MNTFLRNFVLLAALLTPQTGWSKIIFICHKGMSYDAAMVKRSYTGQLDEAHMVDNKVLKSELLKFVDHSESSYKKMWTKQYFRRAIIPPILKDDDEAVIKFVAQHGEGLGYVGTEPRDNRDVEVCGQ